MLRMESENVKPTSIEELQKAMMEEFVPANEQATARVKLMKISLKNNGYIEDKIAQFEDLVTLCGTQRNECYICFFNSLPKKY